MESGGSRCRVASVQASSQTGGKLPPLRGATTDLAKLQTMEAIYGGSSRPQPGSSRGSPRPANVGHVGVLMALRRSAAEVLAAANTPSPSKVGPRPPAQAWSSPGRSQRPPRRLLPVGQRGAGGAVAGAAGVAEDAPWNALWSPAGGATCSFLLDAASPPGAAPSSADSRGGRAGTATGTIGAEDRAHAAAVLRCLFDEELASESHGGDANAAAALALRRLAAAAARSGSTTGLAPAQSQRKSAMDEDCA